MFDKLIVVVLGGLVGFGLTLVKDALATKKAKTADTHYLAILVMTSLERFIVGCREIVSDNGYTDQNGYTCTNVSTPKFDPLSLEVEWKILPPDLLYSLLSLPQLLNEADSYISSVSEHVATPPDYDEFYDARSGKYASLGLLAIQMSEELRILGNLPKRKVEEWGDRQTFLLSIQEVEQREFDRRESQKKMFSSLQKCENA